MSAPYWRAAGERRLLIQRCRDCGTHRHPPTPACYACGSLAFDWDEVDGTGRVYSFVWTHRPVVEIFENLGVYNVAVVELDGTKGEPVRILSRVNGIDRDSLIVGLEVRVDFDPIDDEIALPVFEPLP
ncbi:Zn-ribbon domain-containing OB-fold protein [Candidatus Poriferisocius sp.]|uniref:Zn-ribbon domain-containing OB-fold protein n=1 Tax=Candidatus Poriferisocius sp. TaxID=3101276 RepID=UPI003B0258A1